LEEALFSARAEAMAGQSNPLLFEDGLSPDGLRRLSTALSAVCPGVCAVFSGQDNAYHYALCSATQDVRPLGAALNNALNGRGGGQSALVQGTVCATREAIETYFSAQ
jgi:alanyl-tRNA synthetase